MTKCKKRHNLEAKNLNSLKEIHGDCKFYTKLSFILEFRLTIDLQNLTYFSFEGYKFHIVSRYHSRIISSALIRRRGFLSLRMMHETHRLSALISQKTNHRRQTHQSIDISF